MRVLFLPIPGIGHSFPAVPLAWALRSAGHDVLFGTAFEGVAVERAGLPVVDLGLGADDPAVFGRIMQRHPELSEKIQGLGGGLTSMTEAAPVFAELAAAFGKPVVDLATSWRPDLVLHTPLHGAALLAAAVLGVPAIAFPDGLGRARDVPEALAEHLGEVFAEYGVDGLPAVRQTLDVAPPSLLDGPGDGRVMRYVPFNGGTVVPDWLAPGAGEPERPRIAVTLGSVQPQLGGLGPVGSVLELAGEVDADFVLALGDVDTDVLGPLPANVRVVGWLPLSVLLPGCTALVHHGGGGSTLTGLVAGVSQLVLQGSGDWAVNTKPLLRRGAALTAPADELDGPLLRRLIEDRELRAAAAQLRDEIATLPSPAAVAAGLEQLVA
jgi:UDP:flavonoid glycosyltransferase YjiC (YdhE family)